MNSRIGGPTDVGSVVPGACSLPGAALSWDRWQQRGAEGDKAAPRGRRLEVISEAIQHGAELAAVPAERA